MTPRASELLPTSTKAAGARAGFLALHPIFYVASWMFFSNLTILFNKWLIDNAGFRYPVVLTWWHMTFAALATQLLARTTSLLDGRHNVNMTQRLYIKAVVPIGFLYSGSMVCSNLTYLHLNVAFIQMLKAAAPFFTLVIAWMWGQEHLTVPVVLKIMGIVFGVLLASAGEIHFSMTGFLLQLGGLIFESTRVVMIKALMSDASMNMDPLVSLYYYAPVCALINLGVAWFTEGHSFQLESIATTGPWVLFLNALVAFMLNISSVLLIGKTSGLMLHITGVLKNIILIVASVFIWGTTISPLQIVGYGIALTSFILYKLNLEDLKACTAAVIGSSMYAKLGSVNRRFVLLAVFVFLALMLVLGSARYRVRMPPLAQTPDNGGWHAPRFLSGG